jgi:hypothetical protein
MSSIRRHEGYLLIDNRDSPGVKPGDIPSRGDVPFVSASTMYEAPTYTCSHCQRVVWMNPDRTRERAFCRRCNHVLCDGCGKLMEQTRECVPFKKIIDDAQEAAERAARSTLIIP